MATDSVIFDVEGTLVDSVQQTIQCWRETLLQFGHDVSIHGLQACSGMDGNMMLERLFPQMSDDERKVITEAQGQRFENHYLPYIRPFEGVRETLLTLKSRELKFALATDCQGPTLNHYRHILQIDDLIDAIACGEDAPEGKPNPELVEQALRKLGTSATNALMVGDTPFDAKAARKAGASCVGLLTGGYPEAALRAAGYETVLKTIRELSSAVP
jgi:HAD superfamily hydrolase (TIGR01509 family)